VTDNDAAGAAGCPVIALTTSQLVTDEAGVRQRHDAARSAYAEAIAGVGGLPVLLPTPSSDSRTTAAAAASRALDLADGLLLTGGGDVAPARYGQTPHPATKPPNDARDEFEIALASGAIARGLPMLGICRGAQVLCVATGGDLVQDIASQVPGALDHALAERRHEPVHEVRLAPDCDLAAIYGTDTLAVNSTHHQAPGRLAGGLIAVGHAPDGVIETVALPSAAWVVGVQWHPEDLWKSYPQHRRLFEAFVRAAAARRRQERMEHAV
jgi:putative glutamine amidotransferase